MNKQESLACGLLIDSQDEHILDRYSFYLDKVNNRLLTVINANTVASQTKTLTSFIVTPPPGFVIDHINRNRMDERRVNLRIVSPIDNAKNKGMFKNNTSDFKGVSINKATGKWHAQIRHDGKKIHIGFYITAIEAAKAYDLKALTLHGDFACTNKQLGLI